jgi:aryl-alcohol dehydrogenase-like predicted oxidoreductase
MQYNRFGQTGMNVSRVGLGTFLLGKMAADEALMEGIVGAAIEGGVNLIDTADTYFDAEIRLGKALKRLGKRDQVFLSTKVYKVHSHGGDSKTPRLARNSRTNILNAIDASLRRLSVEHVDVLLLHHPDSQASVEESMRALDHVVKAGKARYVGASNHYAWQVAYSQSVAERLGLEKFSVVQNCYSLVWRVVELEYLHYLRKMGLGFMVYSPLGVGLLTGDFEAVKAVEGQAGEFRRGLERRGIFEGMVRGINEVAREVGMTVAQLAMAWLFAKPVVSTVLLGATEAGHLRSVFEVVDRPLDAGVVEKLDALTAAAIYLPYRNQPEVSGGV